MSFVLRLFLFFFFITSIIAWFILDKSLKTLDDSVRTSAEEVMVDSANFIAELVSQNVILGEIQLHQIHNLIPAYLERRLDAEIYTVMKTKPDMQVYITDKAGQVLYDSFGQSEGEDFSRWRDVHLTLRGDYGARTSIIDEFADQLEEDPQKALYIGAPVYYNDEIVGVVTVSKGLAYLEPFMERATRQMQRFVLFVVCAMVFFSMFMTWWLSRSMRKLGNYADLLGSRQEVPAPRLRESEFAKLADAMQRMKVELEDKEYIENYLHSLAHELKSPLTSLSASAELLNENQDPQQQSKLANNISQSSERMNLLVERMLNLASVERQRELETIQEINLSDLISRLVKDRSKRLETLDIKIETEALEQHSVTGDSVLLEQAIANLIDNAIEFSPSGSSIKILSQVDGDQYHVSIMDNGPGIPEYAKEKIFERFYSLPRPESQQRSTGLGLSFVNEVMKLHKGIARLENRSQQGTSATISWPLLQPTTNS